MTKEEKIIKVVYTRVPLGMYTFLKSNAWNLGETMNSIILNCLEKYKKQVESKSVKS